MSNQTTTRSRRGRAHRLEVNRTKPKSSEAPIGPGLLGGSYKPLSQRDLERIHQTSLDVLEHIGMAEPIDSCRDLVLANGGRINERGRLCFPRSLVEDVIAGAGRNFVLYGRTPDHDLDLTANRVHYGGMAAAIRILDMDTGKYRETTLADLYDLCRIEDALPNLHYVHRPCIARDMQEAKILDVNTAYAIMSATCKHFATSFFDPDHLRTAVEMFDVSLGREGAYRERPFNTLICAFVVSPLRFAGDSCRTLEAAVRAGMPVFVSSAGQTGATSPTAPAGALVQGNAECLAALVFANLISPGHPVMLNHWYFVSDLRTGAMACGGGEMPMMAAAVSQLAHFYDIPVAVASGLTDAKCSDAQAGWEKGYHSAMAGLAGANMIMGGVGGHAALTGISPVSLVIDNDMLGGVLRGIRGIEVTDDTLSYEVIREVIDGPGHYLTHPQTLRGMTRDYVYPEVGNRDSVDVWEASGAPDIRDVATHRAREILRTHFPDHIDPQVDMKIRERFDIRLPVERMRASRMN